MDQADEQEDVPYRLTVSLEDWHAGHEGCVGHGWHLRAGVVRWKRWRQRLRLLSCLPTKRRLQLSHQVSAPSQASPPDFPATVSQASERQQELWAVHSQLHCRCALYVTITPTATPGLQEASQVERWW